MGPQGPKGDKGEPGPPGADGSPGVTIEAVNAAIQEAIAGTGGSSLDNYSTEEQRIGTWIDGNPIYRMAVVGVIPSNGMDYVIVNNADLLLCAKGVVMIDISEAKQMIIPWSMSVNDQVTVLISYDNNICIRSTGAWRNKQFVIVVEYTKTTKESEDI